MGKLKHFISFFLIVFTLLFIVSCSDYVARSGKVHIVCVGIDYEYTTAVGSLSCCPKDAEDMMSSLEGIYNNMEIEYSPYLMLSKGATPVVNASYPSKNNILSLISNLEVEENDMIVFYYSGHGAVENGVSYFCTADETKTSYTNLEVDDVISALKLKNCPCSVIIDACFCGSDYANAEESHFLDSLISLVKKVEFSKIAVLASSSKQQKSQGSYNGNSVYTGAILTTLETTSGPVTLQDLYRKIGAKNSFSSQTPEVNTNETNVYLIPRKF